MNCLARLLAVTLISHSFSLADAEKQAATPVFTSATNFVQVPVIVHRSGKHVAGLKQEDFVLRQDGKEQPIASFEEVHRTAPAEGLALPTKSVPGQQTTALPISIIALDMVDTPNLDRSYFTQEFERYLNNSARLATPTALVAIERNGVHLLSEFTTDPKVLLAAAMRNDNAQPSTNNLRENTIQQITDEKIETFEEGGNSPQEAAQLLAMMKLRTAEEAMFRFQDRSSRIDTMYAIQQLAQALKGLPGRKTLLLVGSGFKFVDSNVVLNVIGGGSAGLDLRYSVENGGETLNQTLYTWKLLNDANVAVYPIDTRRTYNAAFQTMDTSGANTPSELTFHQNQQADQDVLATFKSISAATGGKPCFYRTDLDNCVREAIDDDHDYYLLGFYADKKNNQRGWHRIDVKLNQKADVRYRQGFMLAKFNLEATRRNDIGLALKSPFAYTELPFTVAFEPLGGADGKNAKFTLRIPPQDITFDESNGHADFDVIAIARSRGGKEAGRVNQHIARKFPPESIAQIKQIGIDYSNRLELGSGEYGVWFVVRDNLSGRTGSAVVPLKVP